MAPPPLSGRANLNFRMITKCLEASGTSFRSSSPDAACNITESFNVCWNEQERSTYRVTGDRSYPLEAEMPAAPFQWS